MISCKQREAEESNLFPGVIYVVLALNVEPGSIQY